jgi:diguanylate cyclase (GGDEF)-like protein
MQENSGCSRDGRATSMQDRLGPPRAATALAAAVLAGFLLATHLLSGAAAEAVSNLAQFASAGAAAATTAAHARRCTSGRLRAAWLLLAGSCASWCVGQAYWTWLSAHGAAPFPSLADVGFLGFAVLAALALLLHPADGGRTGLWQRVFDAVMTSAAVGLVSRETTFGAVVAADDGHDLLARALLLAYPVADVAMVVLVVVLLTRTRGDRTALNLVGLGVLVQCIADSTFIYLSATGSYDGGPVDVGWLLAFLLIAVAGACPVGTQHPGDRPRDAAPPSVPVSFLPYIPVVAAFATVLGATFTGHPLTPGEVVVVAVVVGMLLARQYATVRDNSRLTADLADREAELHHLAFHDSLTGLANRALFRDRLGHALHLHARDLRAVSVIFLDLDDFKAVNDTLGHGVGDTLLCRVAARIAGALRGGDTIARLGGDEFAVLLEDGGDGLSTAARIADALRAPFLLAGQSLDVRASIGVCALEPGDPSIGVDTLLARSDAAMYRAKHGGKARVISYDAGAAGLPVPLAALPAD